MRFSLYFFTLTVLVIFAPYGFLYAFKCPHCDHLRGEECFTVRTAVKAKQGGRATGKWIDTVTPKRGWTCTYAEDLGKGNTQQCEMCEKQPARYLHYMIHGTHPQLKVGCECAAYMEGRLDNNRYNIDAAITTATNRENRLKRRAKFPNLKKPAWKTLGENSSINYKKRHIAIFPSRSNPGRYSVCIDRDLKLVPDSYASILEAKLAVFDYLDPFPHPTPSQSPVLQTPIGLRQSPSATPTSHQPPALQYPIYLGQVPSVAPAPYQFPTQQHSISGLIPSVAPAPYQFPAQQHSIPGPIPSVAPAPYQFPAQQHSIPGPISSVAPTSYRSQQEYTDEEITKQLDRTHL